MQRDTALTFRDIHQTEDALYASIKEIEETALVGDSDDATPLKLRFLREDFRPGGGRAVIELTPAIQLEPGFQYVSVSYTWSHFDASVTLEELPDYRIRDANTGSFREPKCPLGVLHRAMAFAHQKCVNYIWIDQECINQSDPDDIENHLQVMHRIYLESRWTVGVLSSVIPTQRLLDALEMFLDSSQEQLALCFPKDGLHIFARVLRYVADDRWFTRTWTFQERNCASRLFLLVPIASHLARPANVRLTVCENDLLIEMRNIGHQISEYVVSAQGTGATRSATSLELRDLLAYFTDISGWRNAVRSWPGLDIRRRFDLQETFKHMEGCDNSIVSDRIAIFGNIHHFEFRLMSTLLRGSDLSYSTCMLVLLLANILPRDKESGERNQNWNIGLDILDATIKDVFSLLQSPSWPPTTL